jgi:hypothetical protein
MKRIWSEPASENDPAASPEMASATAKGMAGEDNDQMAKGMRKARLNWGPTNHELLTQDDGEMGTDQIKPIVDAETAERKVKQRNGWREERRKER